MSEQERNVCSGSGQYILKNCFRNNIYYFTEQPVTTFDARHLNASRLNVPHHTNQCGATNEKACVDGTDCERSGVPIG